MKKLSLPTSIPDRPQFQEFDASELIQIPGYNRNLPHWRLEGVTYFVTFRLADSIPAKVAKLWKEGHEVWLLENGIDPALRKKNSQAFSEAYLALPEDLRENYERGQTRQFFIELDKCHGCCVLKEARELIANALGHFHRKRVWTGDFVVMPNDVHVIVQPFPGVPLEEWLYSVKRFSSRAIKAEHLDARTRAGHLWQTESFDRIIRDGTELERTRSYIANNPKNLKQGEFMLKQAEWQDEFAPQPAIAHVTDSS